MREFYIRSRFPYCKGCAVAQEVAQKIGSKRATINCTKVPSEDGAVKIATIQDFGDVVVPGVQNSACPILKNNPDTNFLDSDGFSQLVVREVVSSSDQ